MSAILDQEMPQKKKRRLGFWLLFFGVVIGLSSAIGWMMTDQELASDESETNIEKEEMVSSEVEMKEYQDDSSLDIEQKTSQSENDAAVVSEIPNPSHYSNPTIQSNTPTTIDYRIKNNSIHTISESIPMNGNGINFTKRQLQNKGFGTSLIPTYYQLMEPIQEVRASEPVINVSEEPETEEPIIQEATTPTEKNKEPILDITPVAFLEVSEIPYESYAKELAVPTLRKPWEWAVEGAYNFQSKNEMGISFGLIARHNFKSRFYLETGLLYNVQFLRYGNSDVNNLFVDAEFSGANTEDELAVQDAITNRLSNLNQHYLRIPMHFGYQMKNGLSFKGGAVASVMLFERNGIAMGQSEDLSLTPPLAESYNVSNSFSSNFEVLGSVGIDYRWKRKWQVGLRYDMGYKLRNFDLSSVNNNSFRAVTTGYNSKVRLLSLSGRMYF